MVWVMLRSSLIVQTVNGCPWIVYKGYIVSTARSMVLGISWSATRTATTHTAQRRSCWLVNLYYLLF